MRKNRRLRMLAAACLSLAACGARAGASGGDWFDDVPMTLADSLDMLPAKSMGEIFLETAPHETPAAKPDFERKVLSVADRLQTEPAEKLLPEIDKLLAAARVHYTDGGRAWCAVLHDVRDVLSGSAADPAAARAYIRTRVEKRDWFTPPEGEDKNPEAETYATDLDIRAEAATGPLKAHWLYLSGAVRYVNGDLDAARKIFERVVAEFPTHPRAEMALFMVGRCAFSQARAESDNQAKAAAARGEAEAQFQRYVTKYPDGRMIADVRGWLGAIAMDGDDYLKALRLYIAQAETPGHPETLESAVFMCETALAHVAAKPDGNAAFELVAAHPRIAMGFTYLVLGAPEADNYDGKFDKPADVKKWRRMMLPRIAAEVVKQKESYKSGDWQPRYLAMLALAASEKGDQAQAIELTGIAPRHWSDDLLFARALAQQRAGKAPDAVETYEELLARLPSSPLAKGVRLRLALALEDAHRAGEAVVQLKKMSDAGNMLTHSAERYSAGSEVYPPSFADMSPGDSAVYPDLSGADLQQVQTLIDTLLNFAPLDELAAALDITDFDPGGKSTLRQVIAERFLEREDFAEAKKFMTPAQFGLIAANLEQLSAAAGNAKEPGEKAAALLGVGNAWAAARGKLLKTPLDDSVPFTADVVPDSLARRENGQTLGFKDTDAELEERDELRHASRWWMRAAGALPATPLAAEARWKALDAMAGLARASAYAEQRAREIQGDTVSRELYDRLRSECPGSVEARRYAAYWSFPEAKSEREEQSDSYEAFDEEKSANAHGYRYATYGAFGATEESGWINPEEHRPFSDRVAALRDESKTWAPAKMAAEARDLDAYAKEHFHVIEAAGCANFLEDLALFSTEPALTPEMQGIYVNLRLDVLHRTAYLGAPVLPPISTQDSNDAVADEIRSALRNPVMKPVADYLEFSLIGLVAGARTGVDTGIVDKDGSHFMKPGRDYAQMEKMTRDFLRKYPRSRKREAAVFLLARCVQALSRPFIYAIQGAPPGAPAGDGIVYPNRKTYQAEAFNPKRVLGALDDYDRQYPHGRYAADIRDYRAYALWRMHDWSPALGLTLSQMADAAHPELQPEAATRLANIFAELEDAAYRADVLQAVKKNPAAVAFLKDFAGRAVNAREHPLRYLQSYLADQLR